MITATLIDSMGSDLSVVNAARVSFGKKSKWVCSDCKGTNWKADWDYDHYCADCRLGDHVSLSDKDTKLVQYLAKHKHYSPFGHCFASFHIKAPIFVARQLVKHEYLRMNEISRRYVDSEPEFYVPEVWRGRAKDKKQGSEGVVDLEYHEAYGGKHIKDRWQESFEWSEKYVPEYALLDKVQDVEDDSLSLYNTLLKAGVSPEMARMVLPQSMYTEWYWSGSMDAFANMCALRLKEDTQYETRLVAQQIDTMMAGLFPVSWKALVPNDNT